MGSKATRSVFAAALCAGVALVGASVNGLMGVDAELQRSAIAADQHRIIEREAAFARYKERRDHDRDCPGRAPTRDASHLS
jgi:hypothetical protein